MEGNALAAAFLAGRPAVLRYLRARGAGEEAEDLLQELWLKLAGVDASGIADPLGYLYRMAHNLMLDRRRGTQRRTRRESAYHEVATDHDVVRAGSPAPERTLIAREQLRHVERALAALGTRADFVFRRYRVEGVAQRDIAAELGISVSAVEKHLQRAYRAVAEVQRRYARDAAPEDREAVDGPR